MRKKVKEFWNILKWALVPAGICAAVLTLNFLAKGIWPFGEGTVAGGDIMYSFNPLYKHLYDVLTGGQGIGWTPLVGAGNEAYMSEVMVGAFNPLTWVVFLGGRDGIMNLLSLSLILRVGFSAMTAYICLVKLFPKNRKWLHILLAVTYGLSGYVFKNYTNIFWVDVAGLFPLLVLSLKYMFETRRIAPFTIVMALTLLNAYNLAWMFLVFLGSIAFVYILAVLPSRKEKVGAILRIMAGCLLAAGMTAVTFFVSFLHLRESQRGAVWGEISWFGDYNPGKLVITWFYSLPILGVLLGAMHWKEDKKKTGAFLYGFIMSWVLPAAVEPVNLLWQGGAYLAFPMRYGFIPILMMTFLTERYFEKFFEEDWRKAMKIPKKVRVTILSVAGVVMVGLGIGIGTIVNMGGSAFFEERFGGWVPVGLAIVTLMGAVGILVALADMKRVGVVVIAIVTLLQAGVWTFGYIGASTQDDSVVAFGEEMRKLTQEWTDLDKTARWKDVSALGGENWGVVAGVPVASTFFGGGKAEQFEVMTDFGYSRGRISITVTNGGTLVSDTVLGMRYYISRGELDERYFTEVKEVYLEGVGIVKIYERKGFSGLGFLYDKEILPEIFETSKEEYGDLEQEREISIEVKGEKELYFSAGMLFFSLTVNGEEVKLPGLYEAEKTAYANVGEKVRLGRFKDETVKLKMKPVEMNEADVKKFLKREKEASLDFSITQMDVDGYFKWMEGLAAQPEVKVEYGPDSMKVRVEVTEEELEKYGNKLFLPVTYDEGWKVVKGPDYTRELKAFMSFELEPGVNEIEMRYEIRYLKEFAVVSGIAGAMFVGVVGWEICGRRGRRGGGRGA